MKKFLSAAAAFAALGLISSASATVIDFGAEAENNGERGVASGTVLGPNANIGTAVRLNTLVAGTVPYLDGPGGGEPTAGLGVCGTLDSNAQCDPSNDDNITTDEAIQVQFVNGPFSVAFIKFVGEGHVDFNGNNVNTLLIGVNGSTNATRYSFASAVAAATGGVFAALNSIEFYFDDAALIASLGLNVLNPQQLTANGEQFYVQALSDVPVPGAIPLLLSGLAGLGFAARRKKAA